MEWMPSLRIMGGLCLLLALGCNSDSRPGEKPPDFQEYGALPGLATSPDPELQNELARLEADGHTPALLQAAELSTTADADNGAVALAQVLPVQHVPRALEDVAELYPTGKFVMSSPKLEAARMLLEKHAAACERARAALDRPALDFHVAHASGLMADLSVFDQAELAHRWLALEAALWLEEGRLDDVERHLVRMLRLDHALSHVKHVVPRLKAARLRLEALRIVEALVQHRRADDQLLGNLHGLLLQQLDAWPHDADAWIGDRAQGLHTYEMIRHGYILSVLSDKELAELRQGAGVSATAKAIQNNISRDEREYLAAMRDIIAACEHPYHVRRNLLAKIHDGLEEIKHTPDYPLVAGRILLPGVDSGHRLQAEDRAACEGWALALAAALDETLPEFPTNPLTGDAYELDSDEHRVLVHNALAEPIIVPKAPRRSAHRKAAHR